METKTEEEKARINAGEEAPIRATKPQFAYLASLIRAGFGKELAREDWINLTKRDASILIAQARGAQRRAS